jgi:hypothetical protein
MAAPPKAPTTTIEFIPQEDWERTSFGKFLKWLLNIGRWIVIVTEFIVILAFLSRFKLDHDLTNLNEQVRQKQAIINSSSTLEKEFRFLQKRLTTIESLQKSQIEAQQVLDTFTELTPVGIQLSGFSYTSQKISLTASANSETAFADFLKNLKNSPKFKSVDISKVSANEEKGGEIIFNIKTELK